MGNSVSRVVGCFVPTGNDRSDRNGGGLVFSEPLDEGLGHSFCYVRPPHMESGRFSPDRYGLEDPDPMDLDQSFREDVPETTTFKAISGASVSANTATPKTVGDFHQIAAERAAAFEGSASFSHLPLQPVPRQTHSGPIVTTTDRSFMSAPLERGGGFLSGPLERSFLSGPLDNHHGSDCSHFSAPLGGGYPRKRRRYLSRVVKRARSVLGILRHHHSGVQEGFDSGMLYPNGDGGALQWAQGKAGEDRVHVVVSEEHGWVFVGIYDGFNGPDAPEFLMCNLYKSIYSQLQGLLWDRNPACSCAHGDASQQQLSARSEHGDSATNPLSHQENAQQHGNASNCGEGNGNHDNVVESSENHVNVGKKDNFLGNSENNSHNIDNGAKAEIGRENDSYENDVHKRVGDENDRHVNVVENLGCHADDDIGEKVGRENDSRGNFVNDAGKEVGGENDRHGSVGENSGGRNEDGENGDFNGGRVENVGEISKVETGKCSGCGENEQQENVGSDFIKRVSFHSDLKRSSRGKSLRELLAEEEDEGLDFSVWNVTVDKQKGEGELNSATVDGSENGRTVGEQRHRRGRSLLSSLMRQAYTRRKENHRKQVPWRYEVEKERIEVEKKEEGSARSCTHKCKVGPVDHLSVLKALSRALEVTEEAYLDMTDKVLDENPELALMGSCLLVMLMKDEDVYVMNVGDSRAIVAQRRPDEPSSNSNMMQSRKGHCRVASRDTHLRSELEDITEEPAGEVVSFRKIGNVDVEFPTQGSRLTALQLSTDHSTSIEEEVLRIKAEHPDDSQSIFNDRVKGRLKVTRAFGAGFLKQPKWNNALLEMFRNDYIGTAPYITCTPSLCHHRLGLNDQFIILSSDGLYQYLTNQEVVSHVELFMERNPDGDPAQHLIEELLFRAAKKAGMDFHDLLDIPQGDRRKYHDDVSVMVISLEGRIWKSSGKCL